MLTPGEILGPSGRIAARLNHYEQRPEQLAMAEAVAAAIRDRHHLIAEAGTGVGKSFAYLVPAILAVAQADSANGGRAASRHFDTISLREQLLEKDIPPSTADPHSSSQPCSSRDGTTTWACGCGSRRVAHRQRLSTGRNSTSCGP
jgi:hypothetical protein